MKRYSLFSFILCAFLLVGCKPSTETQPLDCNDSSLTQAEKEKANCFWDMGVPTDRSKNKGF